MSIVIADTTIHRDADGRFSLNDLHRASGGDPAYLPFEFLRSAQTKALVAELLNTENFRNLEPIKTVRGRAGGTYVCKELVYAYAMWISPAFHLQVIRTFDSIVQPNTDTHKPSELRPAKMFPEYFKVARLIGCDKNAAAISANQAVLAKTGENVLALLGRTHMEAEQQEHFFNPSSLIDGVTGQVMNKKLEAAGMQDRKGELWVPTTKGRQFCKFYDTGKTHNSGTPVVQIKWSERVLNELE